MWHDKYSIFIEVLIFSDVVAQVDIVKIVKRIGAREGITNKEIPFILLFNNDLLNGIKAFFFCPIKTWKVKNE